MAKRKDAYRCRSCGAQTLQWLGQCPACREWNTLEIIAVEKEPKPARQFASSAVPISLESADIIQAVPYSSGIEALDRILGHGLMPGSSILAGGEPGIGKSTLLLQLAGSVAKSGKTAVYVSGEESLPQIRARAERLDVLRSSLLAMSTTRLEDVMQVLETSPPALLVVDSVQTISSPQADGLPGNVSQVRAVASELTEACREKGVTLVLVGHVTKDGVLAGPRLLEHMVDVVFSLEGDRRQMFRLMRVFKNRYGPNEELLVFQMKQKGLEIVPDPSTFFLDARDPSLSGTALVMGVDGHRPLAVEVQALVTRTYLNIPRRTALGFDVNRLNLLVAALEKRLKIKFGQADIYARVGGGIRLQEPGLDLALISAILSSYYDIALPQKSIFWGEVDLNGQIRPVSAHDLRYSQAQRLGFSPIFYPSQGVGAKGGVSNIANLQKALFHRNS